MRTIHYYTKSDNLSISRQKCKLFHKSAAQQAFLRHTLKDGIPLCYWFTIETDTHWFDVDIRKLFNIADHPIISGLTIIKPELQRYFSEHGVNSETLTAFLLGLESQQKDICFSEPKPE